MNSERLTMKQALIEGNEDNAVISLVWTEFGAEVLLGTGGAIYTLLTTRSRAKAAREFEDSVENSRQKEGNRVTVSEGYTE